MDTNLSPTSPPPTEAQQAIRRLRAAGHKPGWIAHRLGVSTVALYKMAIGQTRNPRARTMDALRRLLAGPGPGPGPGRTP